MLEARELRCILAVRRSGSLRAAARELSLAPSAVQRTIAALERRLGGVLFERDAAGARPTALGEVVVRHAQERFDLDAELVHELARAHSGESGTVVLGVGLGFLEGIGASVLGPFSTAHPEVAVTVHTGGTDSMVAALAADAVDVAIVLHPPPASKISTVTSIRQPVGLACPADHPLVRRAAGRTALQPSDLMGERFAVMLPGFGLRALYDEFTRVHGSRGQIVLQTDSQAALIGAVARGGAVSLVAPVFLSPAPPGSDLVLLDVADAHLQAVRASLLVRTGRRLPPAARALVDTCAAWMSTLAE